MSEEGVGAVSSAPDETRAAEPGRAENKAMQPSGADDHGFPGKLPLRRRRSCIALDARPLEADAPSIQLWQRMQCPTCNGRGLKMVTSEQLCIRFARLEQATAFFDKLDFLLRSVIADARDEPRRRRRTIDSRRSRSEQGRKTWQ